ncbi:MAG: 3'-5' exonuclease [Balneolaceae bacterium]
MFFVFDIETVPDQELLSRLLFPGEQDVPDEESLLARAAEELGRGDSGFLPPMFHRIVSWAGLWIENGGTPRKQVSWSGESEKEGLLHLFDELRTYKDFGLIHHNGRGFDLPLITYRALRHSLQMPVRLNTHDIRYRFSRHNIDLMDEFSNYGASNYPKLKHLGALIGVPFKQTAEGGDVLNMYRRGELNRVEHYCIEDVIATYIIWLHMRYTSGEIDSEIFTNLNERAVNKLKEIQKEAP